MHLNRKFCQVKSKQSILQMNEQLRMYLKILNEKKVLT